MERIPRIKLPFVRKKETNANLDAENNNSGGVASGNKLKVGLRLRSKSPFGRKTEMNLDAEDTSRDGAASGGNELRVERKPRSKSPFAQENETNDELDAEHTSQDGSASGNELKVERKSRFKSPFARNKSKENIYAVGEEASSGSQLKITRRKSRKKSPFSRNKKEEEEDLETSENGPASNNELTVDFKPRKTSPHVEAREEELKETFKALEKKHGVASTTTSTTSTTNNELLTVEREARGKSPIMDVRRKELKEAFDAADKNKDGVISRREMIKFLKERGVKVSRATSWKNLLVHHNKMNFEKFCKKMTRDTNLVRSQSCEANIDQYKEIFQFLDENGDGLITKDEIMDRMKLSGQTLTDEQVDTMIKMADKNNDNRVDFDEFVQLMASLSENGLPGNFGLTATKCMESRRAKSEEPEARQYSDGEMGRSAENMSDYGSEKSSSEGNITN